METAGQPIDDVVMQRRGVQLIRTLFSSNHNAGFYAEASDRFVYKEDGTGTIDVKLWEDKATALTRTTVYVRTSEVQVSESNYIGGAIEFPETGGRVLGYMEAFNLVFSVHSLSGTEARVLSRIILDYLLGFSRTLLEKTEGQIMEFTVIGKSVPTKGKESDNADNVWVSDVTIKLVAQKSYEFKAIVPVVADVTFSFDKTL